MMIKQLALAALSNYLSGSPGSGEASDGAGFLKELQRAHGDRAADPANRAPAPRPAADAGQTTRTTKPAEPPRARSDDGPAKPQAGSASKSRTDAGRPTAEQRPARGEASERTTKPAESERSANPPADAAAATDESAAADSERADATDESTAAAEQALAAALALQAGAPVTTDATAAAQATIPGATAEAAAQMLAAVRRTTDNTGDAGAASADPASQAVTGPQAAGEPAITAALVDAAGADEGAADAPGDAPGQADTGAGAGARTRRAALDAADLQQAGADHDGPLPTAAQTLAGSFAQSARETAADRVGAADGLTNDRAVTAAAGASGEPPVGLAAGFAGALARAEAATSAAAPLATTTVHAPLGSQAFAPEFAERISTLVAGGIERAEIVVSPKELGPVRIELTLQGDDARLVFTAAHPDTRQAIEQSSSLLRSMLADQGLTLGRMDVGQGGDPRAGSDGRQASGGPADDGTGQSWPGSGPAAAAPARAAPRGLLDLFA